MTTEHRIVCWICSLRQEFPHYGKEKLKVLLAQEGITISSSTIGRVIARNHLPGAPRRCVARRKKVRRLRLPTAFVTSDPGGLVSMDVVILQQGSHRKYVITVLDHHTRLGLAHAYPRLSSRKAEETLSRMELALGTKIEHVLTDNGAEFFGVFEHTCRARSITHYRTYPRSPKMNARMERFNRTLQEEARLPLVTASVEAWNTALADYLLDYNFHRPHWALGYQRPIDAYCASRSTTPEQSRMCSTHTSACLHIFPVLVFEC
jgi:transposase InsO family protein